MRFVPGFSQTAAVWDAVRDLLPDEIDSTALEVPDGLDFVATATALGAVGGRGAYVGYSMGGRLCLQLALDHPEIVDALVLVSATPGIADDGDRAVRRRADDQLADEVERDGAVAFLDRWVRQPMFAGVPEGVGRAARLGAGDEARLEHQLRVLGQGSQASLWARLDRLTCPVAFITGRADEKYDAIAERMLEVVGRGARLRLPGGHSLLLEQPQALADALVELAHTITE